MKLNKLQYICAILMCYTSTQMFAQQYSGHNSSNLTSVEWTLDECINYALEHNADIAMGGTGCRKRQDCIKLSKDG